MSLPHQPTIYRGTRYRSRLEARWAVFFDTLQIPAQYEPTPVRLPSGVYIPDFWLPTNLLYIECKPQPHARPVLARLAELTHATDRRCALLVGTPTPGPHDVLTPAGTIARASLRFAAPAPLAHAVRAALTYRFAA